MINAAAFWASILGLALSFCCVFWAALAAAAGRVNSHKWHFGLQRQRRQNSISHESKPMKRQRSTLEIVGKSKLQARKIRKKKANYFCRQCRWNLPDFLTAEKSLKNAFENWVWTGIKSVLKLSLLPALTNLFWVEIQSWQMFWNWSFER